MTGEESCSFDEWFKNTFPQYVYGKRFIEPYYSIADLAYDKGYIGSVGLKIAKLSQWRGEVTEEERHAQEMARKAWENLGQVQTGFIGDAYVGFSIEKDSGKYLAMLSVNVLTPKKDKELVRLFFGDKKTIVDKGLCCTIYSAEYDAPKEA